jgi:hypothetical protein
MKVAANTVERILIAAQDEIREAGKDGAQSSSMQELVEAFRKADELRRVPYHVRELRGIKSGVRYPVIVTTQRKVHGAQEYALCLVANAGLRPFQFTVTHKEDGGKVREERHTIPVSPAYREQWVRIERLREAA